MSNQEVREKTIEIFGRYISRNETNLQRRIDKVCPDLSIETLINRGAVRKILDGPHPSSRHYQLQVFEK